jgi:hypothetical protein
MDDDLLVIEGSFEGNSGAFLYKLLPDGTSELLNHVDIRGYGVSVSGDLLAVGGQGSAFLYRIDAQGKAQEIRQIKAMTDEVTFMHPEGERSYSSPFHHPSVEGNLLVISVYYQSFIPEGGGFFYTVNEANQVHEIGSAANWVNLGEMLSPSISSGRVLFGGVFGNGGGARLDGVKLGGSVEKLSDLKNDFETDYWSGALLGIDLDGNRIAVSTWDYILVFDEDDFGNWNHSNTILPPSNSSFDTHYQEWSTVHLEGDRIIVLEDDYNFWLYERVPE